MKRIGFYAVLLASILIISQAATQQTTQQTPQQTTQQQTQQPTEQTQTTQQAQTQQAPQVGQQTTPAWADPRLDEVEDLVMVRFANLSPNTGNVEISLIRDGQTWTFAQPATQSRFGQQSVDQQQMTQTQLEQAQVGQAQQGQQQAQQAGDIMQPAQEQAPQAETRQQTAQAQTQQTQQAGQEQAGQQQTQQPGQEQTGQPTQQQQTQQPGQEGAATTQQAQQQADQQQTIQQQPAQEQAGQQTQQPGQEGAATTQQAQQQTQQPGQQQTQQPGQEQTGQQTQQQTEQVGQQQEITGTATLEIYVEPEDAVIAVAGPFQLAGQFQGSYRLSNLPAGTYVITVARLGYDVQEEEVELGDDDTQTLEISLQEAEGDIAERQRQEEQPEPEEPATTLTPRQDVQQETQQQPEQQQEMQQEIQQQVQPTEQTGVLPQEGLTQRRMAQPNNLAYQDVTGYFMLPAGDYEVRIIPAPQQAVGPVQGTQQQVQQTGQQQAGQEQTAQEQVGQQFPTTQQQITAFEAYETTINLAAGNYYTVAAVGLVRGTDAEIDARVAEEGEGGFFGWLSGLFGADDTSALELQLAVYEDAPGNLPRAGHASVRVIHAAPGSDAIEVRAWRGQPTVTQGQMTQPVATQQQTTQQPGQEGTATTQQQTTTQQTTTQQTTTQQPTATQQQAAWTTRTWDEGTDRLVAAAAYLEASPYEEVRAYAYDLELRLVGQEEGQLPAQSLSGINFEPGGIYTVFISGTDFAGYPLTTLVSLDTLVLGETLQGQGWGAQQNLDVQPGMQQGTQQGQ